MSFSDLELDSRQQLVGSQWRQAWRTASRHTLTVHCTGQYARLLSNDLHLSEGNEFLTYSLARDPLAAHHINTRSLFPGDLFIVTIQELHWETRPLGVEPHAVLESLRSEVVLLELLPRAQMSGILHKGRLLDVVIIDPNTVVLTEGLEAYDGESGGRGRHIHSAPSRGGSGLLVKFLGEDAKIQIEL